MIGVDWGTTSLRAYRLAPDGTVTDRRQAPLGILSVPGGDFAAALSGLVGDWIAAGETRIVLCGMIGSRQGWCEAPYVTAPAGIADLARGVLPVPFAGAQAVIVPGVLGDDPQGVPEVMRGEETQIVGVADGMGGSGLACLPGTHSKWASVDHGRIAGFTTAMTGEAYAVLRRHSILGRVAPEDAAPDEDAFDVGLLRAQERGGLLHHLFGARTLVVTDRMAPTSAPSYLSGLLIGHEISGALATHGRDRTVDLVGDTLLCDRYERALSFFGIACRRHPEDAAAAGLRLVAEWVRWA